MEDNILIENAYMDMLSQITLENPYSVIVSQDLFDKVEEEVLIYALGHFYISVKNILPPFCPIYLHKSFLGQTFMIMKTQKDSDFKLLDLSYEGIE